MAPEEEDLHVEQLIRDASTEYLLELAQGCTEWSCMYHGAYTRELAERRKRGEA